MNRYILTCLLLTGSFLNSWGQLRATRQALVNGGNVISNSQLSMSVSLGEMATQTLKGPTLTLTQGFQQPATLVSSSIRPEGVPTTTYALFPNPTSSHAWLEVMGEFSKPEIFLTDVLGRPVARAQGEGPGRFYMDLRALPSGLYLVHVVQGATTRKVLRIRRN
ncbi:MAG: T9SS type A sorting domain-containing protein [Bacteroidota bacterium]